MNLKINKHLFSAFILTVVILTSGCTMIEEFSDENIDVEEIKLEKVMIYKVSNYTGSLELSGLTQEYEMFIPYSDRYQKVEMPEGIETKRDEYGNYLTTAKESYNLTFEFEVGSTRNDFEDHEYPFEVPSEHENYLEKTKKVDPGNSQIKQISAELTENVSSSFEAVESMNNWTNEYLTYEILGKRDLNTEQILEQKVGSCEEHTWLYTALARSAGIPTRVVAGWVERNGKVEAHMWAESWIPENGWIYVEPSNKEFRTIGVAHLKQYVGPDKLSEIYYGDMPQRTFRLNFDIDEYNCMIKNGKEECSLKSENQVSDTL
ncbi:MAG: transglutaminase domain-containing protein [Candidatus Undinarchaeales archaeon]